MSKEYYQGLLKVIAQEINNEAVRTLALHCLDQLPEYWWIKSSSSSGKHHAPDERGECGLALHTVRVCQTADILMEAWKPPFYIDSVKLGSLFHDAGRYSFDKEPAIHSLNNHPELGARWLETIAHEMGLIKEHKPGAPIIITAAIMSIRRHMGKWGQYPPDTSEDWIVHLADYIATNKYRLT